jgi:DNA-binding beta-propeller fold protein YncE
MLQHGMVMYDALYTWCKDGKGGGAHMESTGLLLAAFVFALASGTAMAQAPLELEATIEMPGVKGRIDHFAADVKGHRLFVAALGNDTVEVLDTLGDKHVRSLTGFGEPQGVAYLPDAKLLYVANGSADRVDMLDGESLGMVKRVSSMADADNVRYDGRAHVVIVGYGKGALRLLRAKDGEAAGEIKLAGHPESFQLETAGPRVFVNVPTAHQVAVVDRVKREVIVTWSLARAGRNFPMALDEKGRRLFVGARSPAVMLVYDTNSGKVVATLPIGGDTDDVFFDAARKRVYVICGEGRVDVFKQETVDRYAHEGSIKTAARARTGFFVPEDGKLYVAAPVEGSSPARVLVYRVK